MNLINGLAIVFSIVVIIGCTKDSPKETFVPSMVENEVRTTLNKYFEAIKEKGLTGEFDYLDNSEDFFWVPPGYASALSYDSVASILSANAPAFASIENRWEKLQIQPLNTTIATYTGQVHSTMIDTSGNKTEMQMIESGVVIKRADGWKLLNGQSRTMETALPFN